MVARFADEEWKYEDGTSVKEDSTNDFFKYDNEYVANFLTLPYKERKALLIVEKYDDLNQRRMAVLSDKCDFSQFVFPIGHPIANQLYIGHPLIPNKYIPFEDYQLEFVEDKVREFCEFVQDLGAIEITIECLNSSSSDNNSNSIKSVSGGIDGLARGASGSVETNNNHRLIDELSKAISLHQTFQPYKKPVLHPNMTWYQNEPSWQRLYNQRMNGSLSSHEERIETKKSQVIDGKELLDVKAELKGIFASLNVKFDKNEESKFEQQENAILSIKVQFAPLSELIGEISNSRAKIGSGTNIELSTNESEYVEEYKECLSNGEISTGERRLLDKLRDKLGITPSRAKELEELLAAPKLTDDEKEYLEAFMDACEDGVVSDKQRRLLDKLRVMYSISEERAIEIEKFY